jgi:osmotically-inducible protein OsmY
MRDSEIEQWVLREISLAAGSCLKELCVLSVDGVVNLKGTVPRRSDRLAVQQAAERAKGVIQVINSVNLRKRNQVRRRTTITSQPVSVAGTFHLPIQTVLTRSQVAG